jgi:Fe-S cluster assembly iron-binding protein IscA
MDSINLICFMIKSDWSDFFSGNPTHEHKGALSRISLTSGGAYVSNALFQNLSGSSDGGAIYGSSISVNVLIEETSFIYCTPSAQGGALYLQISGECIINKVCGYGCYSTQNHYLFSHISVTASYDKRNFFMYSTVCNSVSKNSYTISHDSGKVLFEFSNVSSNKCSILPGIYSQSQSAANNNEIGFNAKYSSITKNAATSLLCLTVYNYGSSCVKQIQSCNLVNNTSASTTYGVFQTIGKLIIKDSSILGNRGKYQVYEESGSYGSTISNCTIDFTSSSVTSGITITNTPATSFINKISCFSTGECKSSYDSFDDLIIILDPTEIICKKVTCNWNRTTIDTKMIVELIFFICSYLS